MSKPEVVPLPTALIVSGKDALEAFDQMKRALDLAAKAVTAGMTPQALELHWAYCEIAKVWGLELRDWLALKAEQ